MSDDVSRARPSDNAHMSCPKCGAPLGVAGRYLCGSDADDPAIRTAACEAAACLQETIAALRAENERMKAVVEAAVEWRPTQDTWDQGPNSLTNLVDAVDAMERELSESKARVEE